MKEKTADEMKMLKELLEQAQTDVKLWQTLYKNLKEDFEKYKKDEDINYLNNNHHKHSQDIGKYMAYIELLENDNHIPHID